MTKTRWSVAYTPYPPVDDPMAPAMAPPTPSPDTLRVILEIPPRYFSRLPASAPALGLADRDDLDRGDQGTLPVIDRRALAPEEHGLAPDLHMLHLADIGIPDLLYPRQVCGSGAPGRQEDVVDEHGGLLAVERYRVLLLPLAHHLRRLDTGQLLDRLVPRNDRAVLVNGKDRVLERLDGIDQPFPVIGIGPGWSRRGCLGCRLPVRIAAFTTPFSPIRISPSVVRPATWYSETAPWAE